LTPFGEHMLPFIIALVGAEEELLREAAVFHDPPQKLIRVGFSALLGGEFVVRLLEPFRQRVEGVELVYKECSVGDMETRLDHHRIDVVLTALPTKKNRRRSVVLHRESLRFLPRGGLDPAARLRWAAGIPLEDVAQELLVFTRGDCGLAIATRERLSRRGLRADEYRGEALSYRVLEEWSELGIGAAMLPASRMTRDPNAYPVVLDGGEPVQLEYRAIWNHEGLRPTYLTEFIQYIKTSVP